MWWWDFSDAPLAADEDTLPDPLEDDFDFPFSSWDRGLDDRAEWERQPGERKCKRCGELDALDSLRHCYPCRRELGRCSWCGIDRVAYPKARACSACYRWLRRNLKTVGLVAAQQQLIANGSERQKRRRRPSPR